MVAPYSGVKRRKKVVPGKRMSAVRGVLRCVRRDDRPGPYSFWTHLCPPYAGDDHSRVMDTTARKHEEELAYFEFHDFCCSRFSRGLL